MADPKTWADRIAAWQASGLSANRFAKDKGYSGSALYYWVRRLEGQQMTGKARASAMLARVVRRSPPPIEPMPETTTSSDGVLIEFAGARVLVRAGFDRGALTAVLDVLDERARGAQR